MEVKALKFGGLTAKRPIVQGGMGVGVSLSSLAGNVAKCGGVGTISGVHPGYREADFKENPFRAESHRERTGKSQGDCQWRYHWF